MATNSIGKLHAAVTADAGQFNQVLDGAARSASRFGHQASRAIDGAANSSRKSAMIFQEGARGLEDFLVSFSTGGIAGGLRGASNNISQMASLLNPMAGAWAAIGVAIGTVAVPAIARFFDLSEAVEKSIEAGKKRFDDFNSSVERQIEIRNKLRAIYDVDSPEEAQRRLTDLSNTLTDARTRQQAIDRNALAPQARLDQLRNAIGPELLNDILGGGVKGFAARRVGELAFQGIPGEPGTSFGQAVTEAQGLSAELQASEEKRRELQKQINDLEREKRALEARRDTVTFRTEGQAVADQIEASMKAAEKDAETRRKQGQQLTEMQLELAIAEAERKRAGKRRVPRDQEEINRLQLQKMDQQIHLMRETIRALKDNGVVGVGGE